VLLVSFPHIIYYSYITMAPRQIYYRHTSVVCITLEIRLVTWAKDQDGEKSHRESVELHLTCTLKMEAA